MLGKVKLAFVLGALVMSQLAAADALKGLEHFPVAEAGQVRQVMMLPELENERNARIELLIGKEMEVDCNRHFFGGHLEEKDLQGWGYTYWVLDELKEPMRSMMACPSHVKTRDFVTMNTNGLIRYNSKLPLIVYVPEGVQVKYRVWLAGEDLVNAEVK